MSTTPVSSKTESPLRTVSLRLALFFVTVVLPLYAIKVVMKTDYTDFSVYHRAAQRFARQSWSQVYNLGDGASPFRYAPLTLLFFGPLGSLAPETARLTWFFLQYLWFGLGFFFLYRSLKLLAKRTQQFDALWVTALSVLFILRLCLDTFTIGQISSLMFFAYCLALYGFLLHLPGLAGSALFIPSLLKIGPTMIYAVFLSSRKGERKKAWSAPFFIFGFLALALFVWLGSKGPFLELWRGWIQVVLGDSSYYDASHYGSQSLKSFLLRGAHSKWFSLSVATMIYTWVTLLTTAAILLFWALRRPIGLLGRGFFFSVGLMANIWFMPETFKYSLTPLAIPAAMILCLPKKTRWHWCSLLVCVLTISLAGKDLMSDALFFGMQKASIPFFATVFLGIIVFYEAWRLSAPTHLGALVSAKKRALGPWEQIPSQKLKASLLIPFPLDSSTLLSPSFVQETLEKAHRHLLSQFKDSFEILALPYGNRRSILHPIAQLVTKLSAEQPEIKLLNLESEELTGRGAALRYGFLNSSGEVILLAHIEQPAEFSFYSDAVDLLKRDFDLVRANRRLSESRFKTPVRLLSLVYGRHRMGVSFNRLVKLFLPISTTDTHSGTLAMKRSVAMAFFALQTSSEFLFDLELALVLKTHGFREKDLPFTLQLEEEKSVKRMIRETFSILYGLLALGWRYRSGYYSPRVSRETLGSIRGITADDWGLSPGINRGILELAKMGIIKRVSIMATCSHVDEGLEELKSLKDVELGLHFNLTYGKRMTPGLPEHTGLARFMLIWLKSSGNRASLSVLIQRELESQLEILEKKGIRIRYLDGHHHIHVLPGMIKTMAKILQSHGISRIRLPYDFRLWFSRKLVLPAFCILARGELRKCGFTYQPCFYPQRTDFMDQGRLRAKLSAHSSAEIIFHPAKENDMSTLEFQDSYTQERVIEFNALRMLGVL